MTKIRKKMLFILLAIFALTFLSAFTFTADKTISRYELAALISKVVLQALPDVAQIELATAYEDLAVKQLSAIKVALHHKIVCGYADETFRPHSQVTNQELLWYLYRTWDFLRLNAPGSDVTKKLSRLVGFEKHQFYNNLKSSFTLFNKSVRGYEPAEKYLLKRLKNAFNNHCPLPKLEISLVDAVNCSPIFPGFVVVGQKAVASDNNGKLVLALEKTAAGSYEVFATAHGYHSIKLRRDMLHAASFTLKLRPLVGQLDLKVQTAMGKKKDPVKKFKVKLNADDLLLGENGFLQLKRLKHGYHQLQISAKGYKTVKRRIFSQSGTLELEVDLQAI